MSTREQNAGSQRTAPRSVVEFPREFKRSGFEQIDWKLTIFGASLFIVTFAVIFIFASMPEPEASDANIAALQRRVASIAMPETPPPAPEPEVVETPEPEVVETPTPVAEATPQPRTRERASGGGGGGGGGGDRAAARESRGAARAAAAQALAQQGVWAQLSTKSGTGGVAASFGAGDLESSIGQVGGVKRGGTSTFTGEGGGSPGEGAVVGPAGGRSARGGGEGMDVGSLLGGSGVGGGGATSLGGEGGGPGGGVDIDINAIADIGGGGARDDSRSDAAVQSVIRQNLGPVKFCYQRELKLNPNLQGSLKLKLTIQQNGRISTIEEVSDTVGNKNLSRCVQGRIRSWRFEPASGVSTITITLPFSPNA